MDRAQGRAGGGAGWASSVCAFGWFTNAEQFLRSWLFGFLFWTGIALGCLSITHHPRPHGRPVGLVIRRLLEAGSRTLPYLAVVFLPVAFGLSHVYPWARPDEVAADPLLQRWALYLNAPFFLARSVFYFRGAGC